MAGKFELNKGKTGKFSFNLKAGNGQVVFSSQAYDNRRSATAGITSVRKNSKSDARFQRKQSSKKQPYFVITATNGQVIGKSQMYANGVSMEKGIQSVMKNAPDAPVIDMTTEADPPSAGKAAKKKAPAKKAAAKAKKVAVKKTAAGKAVAKKAAVKKVPAKKAAAKKAAAKKATAKKAAVKKAPAKKTAAKKAPAKKAAAKKATAKKAAAKKAPGTRARAKKAAPKARAKG